MNEKVVRVFISSTFEDLQKERLAVKEAVEEARRTVNFHEIVFQTIDLRSGARPKPPLEECLEEVASSHVLIGLIGMRYGSIDQETGKSISELEYDKAIECGIPSLMYISKLYQNADLVVGLQNFIQKVEQNQKRDTFESCDQLRGHVIRDLPPCAIEKYSSPLTAPEGKAIESPKTPTEQSASVVVSQTKELSTSCTV